MTEDTTTIQRPGTFPPEVNQAVPSRARIHDYLLGGDASFEVDRSAADFVAMAVPGVREGMRASRGFLQRAVRYLAGEGQVSQFLDIGSGLPTQGNVHEIAQSVNPRAQVVYADNDPSVVCYAQILLSGAPDTVSYIEADLREPAAILAHPSVTRALDLSRPAAIILTGVLQFLEDSDQPLEKVETLRAALAPGSYLVLTQATADPAASPETASAFGQAVTATSTRQREHILRFFDGLELLEPGLVEPGDWRPDGQQGQRAAGGAARPLAGVAIRR
ncbi:MAG TPA: SAM-dependent methyltransferase [Streptosporangiaceae bacterium]|jgi:O-methyltransferase involved in polyketide biosynthesis